MNSKTNAADAFRVPHADSHLLTGRHIEQHDAFLGAQRRPVPIRRYCQRQLASMIARRHRLALGDVPVATAEPADPTLDLTPEDLVMKDKPKREESLGTLKGKAGDRKFILDIADRLQKNKNFSDVRYQELREVSGNSRDVSFSLNFIFKPTEQAP